MKWVIANDVIAAIGVSVGFLVIYDGIPGGWQAITWVSFAAWIIKSFMRLFDEDHGCGGQIAIFLLEFGLPFLVAGLHMIGYESGHAGLFVCTMAMAASAISEPIVSAFIDE
ncbi:MAG: hypothetical protein E7338_02785 [Clostridiales bacterium]|nr:hypothetical protein [Clostridiales bacterium]